MEAGLFAVVVAVVLLASAAHTVTGFGFALIVVPVLVLVLDVTDAVVLSSLLALFVSLLMARFTRADVPWRTVSAMTAGSLAGMPFGLAALLFAPEAALRLAVAGTTIVMALAVAGGLRFGEGGRRREAAAGALSGVLRTSTSLDGPPVVLYLQGRGMPPAEFRATLAMYFLIGGVTSIVAFLASGLVTWGALTLAAAGAPAVLAGHAAGTALTSRVDAALFRRLVLTLLVLTALAGIATTIEGLTT